MKLESSNTIVETSETMVAEEFSIGNLGVILELLRSKMYSNPIRTVIQEISSNARDAHREVKKGHIPFEIKLPSVADCTFYVRDFGPGITPDRISNVFVQYGNSTKRDDNSQTGGFGLGAKSPFAYSDTFNVESITPNEFGQMMKRTYCCVIDKSKCGKMLQMDSEETTEEQGTKISIAVRPRDISTFVTWTREIISTWNINGEPRPTVLGMPEFTWNEFTPLVGGTSKAGDWSVSIGRDDGKPPKGVFAYVDGIPYTVEHASMNISGDRLTNLFSKHVRLSFKTGEISVSATRDKLDYSQETINAIKRRLAEIFDNLRVEFEAKLNAEKNLWDANVTYCDIRGEFKDIIGDVKWHGCQIYGESFRVTNAAVSSFTMDKGELRCKNNQMVNFDKNTILTECMGLKNIRGRVRTLFKEQPTLKTIYVVQWKEPNPVFAQLEEEQKEWREEFNFEKMEALGLHQVEPLKTEREYTSSGGSGGQKRPMVKVRKFSGNCEGYLKAWPEAEEKDISEVSGLYVLLRERNAKLVNGKEVHNENLRDICRLLKLEVYGIPERFSKLIHEDLIPLDEKLAEEYDEVLNRATGAITSCHAHFMMDYAHALDEGLRNLIYKHKDEVHPIIRKWYDLTTTAKKAAGYITVASLIPNMITVEKKLDYAQANKALKEAVREVELNFPLLTDLAVNRLSWQTKPMKSNSEAILRYLKG